MMFTFNPIFLFLGCFKIVVVLKIKYKKLFKCLFSFWFSWGLYGV